MRAVLIRDFSVPIGDGCLLEGEKAFHLVKVARIEAGEEIKILDGKGAAFLATVIETKKEKLILKIKEKIIFEKKYYLDFFIPMTKKEALDVMVKMAVEFGAHQIFIVRAEYSQDKFPSEERVISLIESALEQSNNSFLPQLYFIKKTQEMNLALYDHILVMHPNHKTTKNDFQPLQKSLLALGPEGGFSPDEIKYFEENHNVSWISLPSPILRAPTALAAGAGCYFTSLKT